MTGDDDWAGGSFPVLPPSPVNRDSGDGAGITPAGVDEDPLGPDRPWAWWSDPIFVGLGFCALALVVLVTAVCLT